MYAGKKIVYSLGRLVEYKGYEYLIDAASWLGDDYVVLIGGGGPLKEKLKMQIEQRGLTDKVKLLGFVPDEDMPGYFGACDVFCLSSVWKTEAFAIVQVEAMSCGKPVVATRIPNSGVSWVNHHGYSGLNVPIMDPEALARAIRELTEDRKVHRMYGEQARKLYESSYTYDRMIDSCMELYDRINNE
jgi:rhamnosyl/mannosyltransferase